MRESSKIVAENIRHFAEQKNLKWKALSERARIGRTTLTRVQQGDNFSLEIIDKLASAFRIQPWELLAPPEARNANGLADGFVRIPRLNIEASAGDGGTPMDHVEVLQHLDVMESWVRRVLGVAESDSLRVIDVKGDSMSPTINHGEVAFVDTAARNFDGEGIYVLIWQDHLLVKRLRIAGDQQIAIHSDNTSAYPPEYVAADRAEQLTICGRVVGWWSLRRY